MQPTSKRRASTMHQSRRQHLANPIPDVICMVVLVLVLLLAGYMHVSMGL